VKRAPVARAARPYIPEKDSGALTPPPLSADHRKLGFAALVIVVERENSGVIARWWTPGTFETASGGPWGQVFVPQVWHQQCYILRVEVKARGSGRIGRPPAEGSGG
jgi:hypothetical protein